MYINTYRHIYIHNEFLFRQKITNESYTHSLAINLTRAIDFASILHKQQKQHITINNTTFFSHKLNVQFKPS